MQADTGQAESATLAEQGAVPGPEGSTGKDTRVMAPLACESFLLSANFLRKLLFSLAEIVL